MASQLGESDILTLVKNKLNSERVKLWLPPYSDEEGNREKFTDELVRRYAGEMHISADKVDIALESLRTSSVERIAARNSFLLTGIAALKVKVAASKTHGSKNVSREPFVVNTKLDVKGSQLRTLIAEHCKVNVNDIKMISSGRIVTDDPLLTEQGIAVTSVILAVILPKTANNDITENDASKLVEKTRVDAEIVASRADDEEFRLMQIADQNGRVINIPLQEKKALSLAMILNEKGKAALKRKNYTEALLLLLEADKEFKKCSAEILSNVDNYGLLCLDITWCYLCLKSMEDLPDAESRLQTCETCLQKSYGANLERLQALKGTTANESALLVRLNLLKGITAFYRRQWKVAEKHFNDVERELLNLKVDDGKLCEIMSLGYSPAEARLGLRSSYGDVEMAVNYILNKRIEKEELLKKESQERKKHKIARTYGKTASGELMNLDFFNTLVSMGFPPLTASTALRQSNNNMSLAVQIIQEHPELLISDSNANEPEVYSDETLAKVISCGFDPEVAKKFLEKHAGNAEAAIDDLVSNGGLFQDDVEMADSDENEKDLAAVEALGRLRTDIPDDEDAHLDITLDDESVFLAEYKLLLSHAQH